MAMENIMDPSINAFGMTDAGSSIITLPLPQGAMQVDISKMMPEDAELILAVLGDERKAEDPAIQEQMQELLQRLQTTSPQFEELGAPPMDTRGGRNMMTPVGPAR